MLLIFELHINRIWYVLFYIWLHLLKIIFWNSYMLHVTVALFLLLCSIPLDESNTMYLFILLLMSIWAVSSLGLLWIMHVFWCWCVGGFLTVALTVTDITLLKSLTSIVNFSSWVWQLLLYVYGSSYLAHTHSSWWTFCHGEVALLNIFLT